MKHKKNNSKDDFQDGASVIHFPSFSPMSWNIHSFQVSILVSNWKPSFWVHVLHLRYGRWTWGTGEMEKYGQKKQIVRALQNNYHGLL